MSQIGKTYYFSVTIPWSDTPTKWHPTEKRGAFSKLSRGAFKTREEAHDWAKANLEGNKYTVRRYSV